MIQVFRDGQLFYDSRLRDAGNLHLLSLTGEYTLNKGGVVKFTMDSEHPNYADFVSHKTIVEVWKNGKLEFRGRALYPEDNFLKDRTITCEGERCFLRDAVLRPYNHVTRASGIFKEFIREYNSQVEEPKQFVVGTLEVKAPSDYDVIGLRSEEAKQVGDAIDTLVETCGGVVVFTTNEEGKRVINWLNSVAYSTNQSIEFGENLLDYATTDDNEELITAVLPYGAQDEETKARVTIKSVNNDKDYIQDNDAVALRGFIIRPIYFDDITSPSQLLVAAKQYLAEKKLIATTIELSAVDLSALDKNIDSFKVGDYIKVRSRPHGVDDRYLLTTLSRDYLHPAKDRVVLGKATKSLTGISSSGRKQQANDISKVGQELKDKTEQNSTAIENARQQLLSLIQQTATSILLQVGQEYVTNGVLTSSISTSLEQLSNSFNFEFNRLEEVINANGEQIEESKKYIRFVDGTILIGEEGNELTLQISNDRISFMQNGGEVAYFSNNKLFVTDGEFLNSLTLGRYAFIPRDNGNLSFRKIKVN